MKDLSTRTSLILYGLGLAVAVIGLFNVTVLKIAGVLIFILAIGLTMFGQD